MMKKIWIMLFILGLVTGLCGMANAELETIGLATYNGNVYKLIYENDQDLIWLDYSFPAKAWQHQVAVVNTLNNPGVLSFEINPGIDINWKGVWRLPLAVDGYRTFGYDGKTTAGFNITTSEMGHLYYKSLGNLGYYDIQGNPMPGWGKLTRAEEPWGLRNTGPFDNLLYNNYWSGTEYSIYTQHAWDFSTYSGAQDIWAFKGSMRFRGIAVRPATVSKK